MRRRLFSVVVLMVSFALLFNLCTSAVTAQGPQPPGGRRPEEMPYRPPSEDGVGTQGVSAQVALGEPGTVFRYVDTFGVTEEAYPADVQHLNGPNGLYVDGSDNLYVVEQRGARMLKFNSAGNNVVSIGVAGLHNRGEYSFDDPKDVTVDNGGNIWIVDRHRAAQYSGTGTFLQEFPPDDPWQQGDDNAHFNDPSGIAFDSTGRMYVSDTWNHRIQVYTFVGGNPVYSATIGETGVSGLDNNHLNQPQHIAIDAADNLYVADSENDRVQIFDSSHAYVATLAESGVPGSDNNHFDTPTGVYVSAGKIYVADRENWRVQIFDQTTLAYQGTIGTGWGSGNYQFAWPLDVAVDSVGNVYVADHVNHRVQKFNSSGAYVSTIGMTGVPYLTDGYHYNHPRVAIDDANNIIVLEENGQRLVKLNADGVFQWSVGEPGVDGDDNAHFSWPHGVAIDSDGDIYVADGNCRVQIYKANGAFFATVGTGCGTGDYEFGWPSGIAVDDDGYIYVSDGSNHRVQIYNSSHVFVGRIGATGQCGSGNDHLCWPIGIEVDSDGDIYVADAGNARAQKFDSNRNWQMTLGTPGSRGDDFSQFDSVEDTAVDTQDRLYVADIWNQRVQVFDSSGAYLTTIGGQWGSRNGQLRDASGVDVDSSGNVYVADFRNSRIQKFAPGVPGWSQVNINGFGNPDQEAVWPMLDFDGKLYAGTGPWFGDGSGQLWRTGSSWEALTTDGFGDSDNQAIASLAEFGEYLYAVTWNGSDGCEVWRSNSGNSGSWSEVAPGGFGDPGNEAVWAVIEFGSYLYAGTLNWDTGTEVWRSANGTDWTQVNSDGFGNSGNLFVADMEIFADYLYVGVGEQGGEIWRCQTCDGSDWSQVNSDGFGDVDNITIEAFGVFSDTLYAGTKNLEDGGEVWRCAASSGCDEQSDWSQVNSDGFGDGDNLQMSTLFPFNGKLWAFTYNEEDGFEGWHCATCDGSDWEQVVDGGLGDSNNNEVTLDSAAVLFDGHLFLGTWNEASGGEVWRYDTPATTRVRIEPPEKTVYLSSASPFSVTLTVENVLELGGFDTELTYDPGVLSFQDVELGSFLTQSEREFQLLGPNVGSGQVSFGAYSVGTETGPDGSGTMAVVTFSPQGVGTSDLGLQDMQLIDTSAEVISAAVYSATVTVEQTVPGDLDGDCDVDIVDVMLVASRWDSAQGDPEYDARYDLNGDDKIDIVDIMQVAIHWGETCEQAGMAATQDVIPAVDGPIVEMSPADATVELGQTNTVDVKIQDADNLGGFEFQLAFDSDKVQVTDITLGDFLGNTGRNTGSLGPEIDNDNGTVFFGGFSYGTPDGPSGEGVLATITFSGVEMGTSALDLSDVQVTDKNAAVQPTSAVSDGEVTVRLESEVTPDQNYTITYTDTQGITTTVQVPSGAVTETVTLAYTAVETTTTTAPANFSFAGRAFELDAYKEGQLQEDFPFEQAVTIEVHYTDDDLGELNEGSLLLYYWDDDLSRPGWVDAGTTCYPDDPDLAYERHPGDNWLGVSVCHLTEFGLFGQEGSEEKLYLPIVVRDHH